jgi:hypothetical protein
MIADWEEKFSRECTRKTRMPEKSNHKGHKETQRKNSGEGKTEEPWRICDAEFCLVVSPLLFRSDNAREKRECQKNLTTKDTKKHKGKQRRGAN